VRVACVNQDPGVGPERKKGAAVHLCAMRAAFESLGCEVVAVDESDEARALAALERAHRERSLTLVYERYALARPGAARFARAHALPYVVEVNAPLAEEEERWRGGAGSTALFQGEREVFELATRVVAVSSHVARYVLERGAAPERVQVHANAVDAQLFRPRAADDALRAELVPHGRLALGFHGRLRPWHGFDLLVRACQALEGRGVGFHLLLVGEGDFEAALRGCVSPQRVTRVGWVEHERVAAFVACFDVLPLTYAADAPCYFSPLKLAEAMACGVVPVVPALGDLASAVRHGVDGLCYAPGDPAGLVASIAELAARPQLRAALAQRAVESARGRSWRSIAAWALAAAGTAVEVAR
jgi:glycosyltransferase involved in cell wall biosynthesis